MWCQQSQEALLWDGCRGDWRSSSKLGASAPYFRDPGRPNSGGPHTLNALHGGSLGNRQEPLCLLEGDCGGKLLFCSLKGLLAAGLLVQEMGLSPLPGAHV